MRVECYAGYAYPERPVAFWWNGRRVEVMGVRKEERTPQGKRFVVETGDERVFELEYDEAEGEWMINEIT